MTLSCHLPRIFLFIYLRYVSARGIVAADMEPTDSRRGYPCFDEPAMKVRYTTIIIHEQKHTALSNMPVEVSASEYYFLHYAIKNLSELIYQNPVFSVLEN